MEQSSNHDSNDGLARYALIRLILVDSYTEGRITELPIEGGTALVSGNGRGKTSLLQLIPAFFGERPDRIVKPVSNQGSFAKYYLPRSTSYVIFEYRRDQALCCAVLTSDPTGEGVEYRFVRGGYQREWFVLDDSASLIASNNLPERLKQHGLDFTRKMPLDQYRAIIQGKRAHGSDLKQHRRDLADYAFCPSAHPLPHIERIVFGMFARKSNFTDLQRMIVSTVTDTNANISLGAERKKIDAWPDSCDSYLAVMDEATRMANVQDAYDGIMGTEQELRNIHGRFVSFSLALDERKSEKNGALLDITAAKEQDESAFKSAKLAITESLAEIDREIGDCQVKLNALRQKHADYEKQDLVGLAKLLDQETVLLQEQQQLTSRRSALLDQQSNIEDEYRKILDTMKLAHQEVLHQFDRERSTANSGYQGRLSDLQQSTHEEEAAARAQSDASEAPLEQDIASANEAIGAARAQANNPQPDPALVAALEAQEDKVEACRGRHLNAQAQEEEARKALGEAKQEYNKAEQLLSGMRKQAADESDRVDALVKQACPDERSLLHFLRTNRTDWAQDIAKVIREDLLARPDLSPALVTLNDSIYGLQIDLEALSTPLAADEIALQSAVDQAQTVLRELNARVVQQEGELATASRQLKAAEGRRDELSALTSVAAKALDSENIVLQSARRDVKQSRDTAGAAARARLTDANQAAETARLALNAHRGKLKVELQAIQIRFQAMKRELLGALNEQLALIKAAEDEAKAHYASQCSAIDNERLAKLQESGVDTAVLTELEQQISALGIKLSKITTSRNLVAQWRVWLGSEWSQKGDLEMRLAQSERNKSTILTDKERLDKDWFDKSERYKAQLHRLTQDLTAIDKEQHHITSQRQVLLAFPPNMDDLPAYSEAWKLTVLVDLAMSQLRGLDKCEAALRDEITALKRAFTDRRQSPPDQYFEAQRKAMGPDRADSPREWVPVFKDWYQVAHKDFRRILLIEARTIADAVGDFRDRMTVFHHKVQQFNRELQDNINANQGFKSIGGLTVEIVSSIRELEYWATVEKVAESRLEWMAGDLAELPPPAFSMALRELLDHWQLRDGIQAELSSLVRIQGEVIENGKRRPFKKAEDLEHISSNGLSYIVMVLLFMAFINRVRGTASVNIVWSLDEIGSLDTGNTVTLVNILKRNNITLVTACPDPKPDVLATFKHRRAISADRRIYEPRTQAGWPMDTAQVKEVQHV
ncbi:ATP-binding protein [Chitiniphilus eburneus]|uniref:ATP-binding protein n=1 Tax=Chitiniphilus eburneus TaxID=2571148 RepID=A0A4U0QED0_9NEIS|nr:ATP-binding protein [Chitiniphilus eburneus]TJZ74224.1 ATP-binding protein [Chitiniphilus eburneus]